MKKLTVIVSILVLILGAGTAWGSVINFGNNTYVEAYLNNNVSNTAGLGTPAPTGNPPWWDRIGAAADFETFGGSYDTDTKILTIKTNWGGGGTAGNNYTTLNAVCADLFVDTNGNGAFDTAIALGSRQYNNPGANSGRYQNIYAVNMSNPNTYLTSQQVFGGNGVYGGAYYGGRYDQLNVLPIPVWATSTTPLGTAAVTWTSGADPQFVTVDLSGILPTNPGDYTISFLWATGTCANDTFEASFQYHVVPIPPSALLLGTGLLGLVGLRWRRRQTNV
jgi:hypothetical protein